MALTQLHHLNLCGNYDNQSSALGSTQWWKLEDGERNRSLAADRNTRAADWLGYTRLLLSNMQQQQQQPIDLDYSLPCQLTGSDSVA